VNDSIAFSDTLCVFMSAFKYFILKLQTLPFFNKVKDEVIAAGNQLAVSKFSWVEVFSLKNGDFIIGLNIMFFHKFF
jgi:hypothetical protein